MHPSQISCARAVMALAVIGVSSPAFAQLHGASPDQIADGASVSATGSVLGETGSDHAKQAVGDVAGELSWTRSGLDDTTIFDGPSWTRRWGAVLDARGSYESAASSPRGLVDLDERSEVALYAGSIGQTLSWQLRPKLTATFWRAPTDQLVAGVFADFGGIGVIKRDDDLRAEAFPVHVEIARDAAGITTELEGAFVRVVGQAGDLRLLDSHVTTRDEPGVRAVALDVGFLSAREIRLADDSPWRMSGAFGLSTLTPLVAYDGTSPPLDPVNNTLASIIPLASIGLTHHHDVAIRGSRSEIGRPLIDDADFGVALGTLHRLVEGQGLDAGADALAWWTQQIEPALSVHGEVMVGIADRVLRAQIATWTPSSEGLYLARGELGASVRVMRGVMLEARVWIEHSERFDFAAGPRWSSGLDSGLSWRL